MPSNADTVKTFLRAHARKYFCQGCISDATGVSPTNQVNQIVRPLENERRWRYTDATCSTCGEPRKCAMFTG
jgi:hypothetical protein